VIVGDGVLLDELKEQVQTMGIQDKVSFTGFLEPDDLRKKIAEAYAGFLLVENLGLSYFYALGNKFFDYVQGGIPQVSIDFPEYKLMHEQHGVSLLVQSLDPKTIADAANKLVDDQALYKKLQVNTIAAQPALCWEHEEQKLIAFYAILS
jgi:glycosyltransferase involved in cell wall biosynthesis